MYIVVESLLGFETISSNRWQVPYWPGYTGPSYGPYQCFKLYLHMCSKPVCIYVSLHKSKVSWNSAVGIATGYGLDGPGIESRWGNIFRTCSARPWNYPASYAMGIESFSGVKRPGRDADPSAASSAVVTEG
jgi:hypothetical protein